MTVKELIAELKKHEPEMNVRGRTYDRQTICIFDDAITALKVKDSASTGETYVALFHDVHDSILAKS